MCLFSSRIIKLVTFCVLLFETPIALATETAANKSSVLSPALQTKVEAARQNPKELAKLFKECRTTECSDYIFPVWENTVWNNAKQSSVRDGYKYYLILFPGGRYVALANKKIENIDWLNCKKAANKTACEKYLITQKRGKHKKEARKIIENYEYRSVKKLNTIKGYKNFLKLHRSHGDAKKRLRKLRYSKALNANNLDAWISFYDKSTISRYKFRKLDKADRSTYQQMVDNAESEIERLLYKKIVAKPSLSDAREYLKRYRKGIHSQQVVILMEPLFYKEAQTAHSIKAYKMYLKQYPAGYSSDKARNRMEPLFWAQTRKNKNYSSYKHYIKEFSSGAHILEANNKIKWMKAHPAKPKISYPKQIIASGFKKRFSWTTRFTEKTGNAGYNVSGSGWIYDKKGKRYGPNGNNSYRGKLTVKAGATASDSHWIRGKTFCGGKVRYYWSGTDTNGHRINLREEIKLKCP